MYADPRDIRHKRLNLSISEIEDRVVEVNAQFNNAQKTAYAREMLMWAIANQHLRHTGNSGAPASEMRVAN